MKSKFFKVCVLLTAALLLSCTFLEFEAHARAGGSRSSGSRGSRSYSPASRPAAQPTQSRPQQAAPSPPPTFQQPASGGFFRSMAGGIVGGMLGGMLFRSLGFGGMGGMGGGMGGGGGIGIFEILLIAGIGYLIYRFIKSRRAESSGTTFNQGPFQGSINPPPVEEYQSSQSDGDLQTGLGHIRQFDPYFDENRFNDLVMDNFFKVQGAWMNRDLSSASPLLTDEMRRTMQQDIEKLLRDRQINRLENIAVRKVEIAEAWQESGQDYITALINANLLDYTTDDTTGAVLSGSKTDPVKFEEFWTFTRAVGNNTWKLSAIDQR